MKVCFKRFLSFVLSFALIVSGLTFTSGASVAVNAADGAFISTKPVLVDDGADDLSSVKYWKGQTFSLSVEVIEDYKDSVNWSTGTTDIVASGSYSTTATTKGYSVVQAFTIADTASGEYTITAAAGGVEQSFTFTVEENALTAIQSTTHTDFTALWTGQEIDLYVVYDANSTVDTAISSDNPLVSISSEVVETAKNLSYYGAGSGLLRVTATIADITDATKNQQDSATISVTIGGETQTAEFYFKQSAKTIKVVDVTCDNCSQHEHVTHINSDGNLLSFDVGQTAVITCEYQGSYVEEPITLVTNSSSTAHIARVSEVIEYDVENNKTIMVLTVSALKETSSSKEATVVFASKGGQNATQNLATIVYKNPAIVDGFVIYYDDDAIAKLSIDAGGTGTFTADPVKKDSQEKVKWSLSGDAGCLEIDENTGVIRALNKSGTVDVIATVQETNSGTRGQTSSVTVVVNGEVLPETLVINDSNDERVSSETTLYVGDANTVYKVGASRSDDKEIYYENYTWEVSQTGIVTIKENPENGSVTITPKAKGTTQLRVMTADGSVISEPVTITVVAPISTITVKTSAGNVVSSVNAIEERQISLTAVRDSKASDIENIVWTTQNSNIVAFLDNGVEVNTVTGNSCVLIAKSADIASGFTVVNLKADGLGSRSTASTKFNVQVSERIPAENILFTMDGSEVTGNSDSNPYEIENNSKTTHTLYVEGYDKLANETNDTLVGTNESTDILTATWDATNKKFTIRAKKAGLASLAVTNEQTGEKHLFWIRVAATDMSDATVVINNGAAYTYTGSAIVPTGSRLVVTTSSGKRLSSYTDYTVTCTNNVNVGTARVVIEGKGNYSGRIETSFDIEPKSIAKATFTLAYTSVVYTGSAMRPTATVKDGTKVLKQGVDYTIKYSNNVNAGTATVVVTGLGNYNSTKSKTFKITQKRITATDVTLGKTDFVYTGKNCKPAVTVKSNGKKLKAGVHYKVTFPADMKSIGKKTITITGKGNCTGTVKVYYYVAEKVTVKKPTIKSVKNNAAKTATIQINKVSGATGYEVTYSTTKKFTAATTKTVKVTNPKAVIKKLTKGKTYYFKVRAYKLNSLKREVYSAYSGVKQLKIKK